jgi:hypothetical protein
MSTAEARVWEIVGQAARAVTDDSGKFTNKEFVEELTLQLASVDEQAPHVRHATIEMTAKSLAARYVSQRNPRPRKQGTLFHPRAILPLGDGNRIWMEQATDSDLIQWARLSTANLSRVALAEGSRQGYVADRLASMRDHPGWTLGRVEREVFGWVATEDDSDFADVFDEDET